MPLHNDPNAKFAHYYLRYLLLISVSPAGALHLGETASEYVQGSPLLPAPIQIFGRWCNIVVVTRGKRRGKRKASTVSVLTRAVEHARLVWTSGLSKGAA